MKAALEAVRDLFREPEEPARLPEPVERYWGVCCDCDQLCQRTKHGACAHCGSRSVLPWRGTSAA